MVASDSRAACDAIWFEKPAVTGPPWPTSDSTGCRARAANMSSTSPAVAQHANGGRGWHKLMQQSQQLCPGLGEEEVQAGDIRPRPVEALRRYLGRAFIDSLVLSRVGWQKLFTLCAAA